MQLTLGEFIALRGRYQIAAVTAFQPMFELQILIHPTASGVEQQHAQPQTVAIEKVALDQMLPLLLDVDRDFGIPIAWEVDELHVVSHLKKIDDLRTTRPLACEIG